MAELHGFLKVKRWEAGYRPVCDRVKDYQPVFLLPAKERSREQASRCMDCGTPFCHYGCPAGNYIPEWNEQICTDRWSRAVELLLATNCLPEITGRVCPAPCEYACVLGINNDPVTIRQNELAIIEHAFQEGLIKPHPPKTRTGKRVAVVGSGPAGLAAAAELNRRGHPTVVFERDPRPGGIMRYGIPDFKLEKTVIDRRIRIWEAEGIQFKTGVNVGIDYPVAKLRKDFDAVCLTGGSRVPRDLRIPGRELKGIYFAMDYLIQSNRRVLGEKIAAEEFIDARGKQVVVIGGGDTGSDCVGTAHRQGAACVVQIELLPQPPEERTDEYPWPAYPSIFKTSSSHEEGGERKWSILTKRFVGEKGQVKKLVCVEVEFPGMQEIPGSDFEIDADRVILAMGFLHPEQAGLLTELGVARDTRGNVATDQNYMTSVPGVFAAGDMRRGPSLIVWAIAEGREAALGIDKYLHGP